MIARASDIQSINIVMFTVVVSKVAFVTRGTSLKNSLTPFLKNQENQKKSRKKKKMTYGFFCG